MTTTRAQSLYPKQVLLSRRKHYYKILQTDATHLALSYGHKGSQKASNEIPKEFESAEQAQQFVNDVIEKKRGDGYRVDEGGNEEGGGKGGLGKRKRGEEEEEGSGSGVDGGTSRVSRRRTRSETKAQVSGRNNAKDKKVKVGMKGSKGIVGESGPL